MEKLLHILVSWLAFAIGALSAYTHNLIGIFLLFFVLFLSDFITGIIASFKKGHSFSSSRARWSFAKTFCYLGTFSIIIFIGICVNQLEFFIGVLKVTVYAAIWFEGVSNIENLLVFWPQNRFLKFIHYLLAVEWVKKIPGLADFLKEEKYKYNEKSKNNLR